MSLLDDYAEYQSTSVHRFNDAAQGSSGSFTGIANGVSAVASDADGFITTTLDAEDAPIFSLDTVQFQVPNKIISLSVSNDILVLVIEGAKVLRIKLQEAHNIVEADIPLSPSSLRACSAFLDPTGRHLLLSTPQGENFYYYEGWDSAKPLSKFKSMEITAVAWNNKAWSAVGLPASSTTRTILFGTHDGKIYETELRPGNGDAKAKRCDLPVKCVAELPVRERVTGIAMEPFPARRKQHLVLIATGTRLYQVIGAAADLESRSSDRVAVFESMLREGLVAPNFQEIPGMPGPGALAIYHCEARVNGKSAAVATDFAWLTSMGVFFGKLSFDAQEANDSVVGNASLLPYPAPASTDGAVEQPSSLALTEFHILLQYSDRVCALNMLNSKLAFEQSHSGHGEQLEGLLVDESKRTCWLFSAGNIYELVVTDEDRDVWEIYLQRRQFDSALERCYNDAQRDVVLRAQAEHYFSAGDFVRSAECFALTSVSFEEAVLRFIALKDNRVLKSYIVSKLRTLRRQDRIQVALLVTWLVEIYLSMLGAVDARIASLAVSDSGEASDAGSGSPLGKQASGVLANGSGRAPSPLEVAGELEKTELRTELYSLVEEFKSYVNPGTVYQLAESHGNRGFWLHYASLRGDYERVVEYWMEKEDYVRAIEVLGHYGTPEAFYRYSPLLMSAEPEALVEILMRQPDLTPNKLIPALMRNEEGSLGGRPNQAIRYLRFCIQKQMCRDPVVYNYYLMLLIRESRDDDESELMSFLTTYGKDMLYDPDYALRMCKRYGRIQSCVHLYSLLKLYEDAVDLALKQGDIELAQIHAERPQDDDKLCKKLWLNIAQHVIKSSEPASVVMELVRRSNRLGVEDILPFFPDFTCVDDFKDDICVALEDYEMQIQELRGEMDEATRTAETMQRDMTSLKNRFAVLNAEETCQICALPLWTRQFYVFPCQHSFHGDCLTRRVVGACNRVQRRRIHELQSQNVEIAKMRRQLRLNPLLARAAGGAAAARESDEQLEQQLRRAKQQLDALVAGECVLCGEAMIKSVAEPFIEIGDQGEEGSWAI
ncbi:tethering complex subunit [Coemansia linderi]|uniref:Tethering complex subunit n=1 Tax=Coemansia linderi TaxID=2663919 RepID=A0ACC1KNU3_9FUNG|nr:tethering complex subunit [Coemansia linderi]